MLVVGRPCDPPGSAATANPKHKLPVAENLLARSFTPTAPNQVFISDITYIWTDKGWLHLAVVLDLFNREVVGWAIKPRMTADIVYGRADDGVVPTQASTRRDASLGPRSRSIAVTTSSASWRNMACTAR